jgi:hypothetical protein
MVLLFVVAAAAIVFILAAVVIGREARRLDAKPPQPVFDMDEAVHWVADHLPYEVSAVLTYDDVRSIIDWNLEYFRSKGVSGNGSSPHPEGSIVVGGAETVEYVLAKAIIAGSEYTPDTGARRARGSDGVLRGDRCRRTGGRSRRARRHQKINPPERPGRIGSPRNSFHFPALVCFHGATRERRWSN